MAILKSKEMKDINKDIVEAGGIALTELEFRDSTSYNYTFPKNRERKKFCVSYHS